MRPGFLAAGQKLLDEAALRLMAGEAPVKDRPSGKQTASASRCSSLSRHRPLNARLVVFGTHGRRGVDRADGKRDAYGSLASHQFQ